jgi:hypothetical protein
MSMRCDNIRAGKENLQPETLLQPLRRGGVCLAVMQPNAFISRREPWHRGDPNNAQADCTPSREAVPFESLNRKNDWR